MCLQGLHSMCVDNLIRMFNNTEPLSIEERERRSKALRPDWIEIARSGESQKISSDTALKQWQEQNKELLRKFEDAKSVLAACNPHNQLPKWDATYTKYASPNQDYDSFKTRLKNNKQDLVWQCELVMAYWKLHLIAGEPVPPYYAERVAILLRKAKEHEKEKQWLAAWCKHFGTSNRDHGKYYKLTKRAEKLG